MSPTQTARRSPDAFDSRLAEKRDIGAELDNIFRLTNPVAERDAHERARPLAPKAAAPAETRRVSQGDLDAALDMLNRAAQAMDLLQARYQQVESYARDIASRAERDLALAFEQKKEWETRALDGEARLGDTKARLDDVLRQAEMAQRRADHAENQAELIERRAEKAERRAELAERGAMEARDWLECFHDRIVASFDTRPFPKSAAA